MRGIFYKFVPNNEIRCHLCENDAEFSEKMQILENNGNRYQLITGFNVDENNLWFNVVTTINLVLNKLDVEMCIEHRREEDDEKSIGFEITLANTMYIESYVLHPSDSFYRLLELLLADMGVQFEEYSSSGRFFWIRREVVSKNS